MIILEHSVLWIHDLVQITTNGFLKYRLALGFIDYYYTVLSNAQKIDIMKNCSKGFCRQIEVWIPYNENTRTYR